MSTLQVHQNYHQDSEATINCQIDPELCASYLYLSMSYYFDLNDVTLRNIAKYFLHQSHKEREHAEKPMKLQNQQRGWIFFQDIKKPVMTGRMGWMQKGVHYTWKKSVNQSLLDFYKLATEKHDPLLCDFIETHYLDEEWNPSKNLVTM